MAGWWLWRNATFSRLQPRKELPRTKRFGDVIVGTHLQSCDFVIKVTGNGENNNGDRGLSGFHLFAEMFSR